MKRTIVFLFTLLTLIGSSCNSSKGVSEEVAEESKPEGEIQDELYQEVITVHDEAMLKMEIVVNLKSKAIKEADSLRELGDESNAERIEKLEQMQERLDNANKSMMVWMRAFRPVADTVSYDKAMRYLKSEQNKITKVNEQIDKVIEAAKAL